MVEKKPIGLFSSGSLRSGKLRSIRPPTTEIRRLLSSLYHNHAVTSQKRSMSSSSERKIWTLISPCSCKKKKNKQKKWLLGGWKIASPCGCSFLDVRPHDRLSTAAVNRKERLWKCPTHWNLSWPYFDLCLQAQQGPRILGHLITCTKLIQTHGQPVVHEAM